MTFALRLLAALALVAISSAGAAQTSAPYRGPGGQLEAAGVVAASFAITSETIRACGERHRALQQRASKALPSFLDRNKATYMAVMRRLPQIAQQNGGDAEVVRLRGELEHGLSQIEMQARGVGDARAQDEHECKSFLGRVEAGKLDLGAHNREHVSRLLQ